MSHAPDSAWLAGVIRRRLTTSLAIMSPSEWAEKKRYLPPSSTSMPGYYRFDVAPYMREIIDCMSPESDVRHVTIMKGVQVGATTLLENTIGYYIDAVKTAPMMLVTADAELAKLRIEGFVVPMLKHSGLDHLIRSLDEQNPRKTGRTDKKYEWEGGGFLVPLGAVNPNKLRSIPIQVLLRDEIDGWADNVGKDGDPVKLSEDRTAAYEASRKIFDCSTPLIKGQSKIDKLFEAGDRRRYYVRCLSCGHAQVLRWRRTDEATGRRSGIVWEMSEGRLVEGSVRYLCEACGHAHSNADKTRLFAPGNAEWRATAEPATAHHRSYHLSALYSPVGMQTWEACAQKWVASWDDENNRPRDNLQLQVFYNNVLGEAFALRGTKLRFEVVSLHRRHVYRFGEVPNAFCEQFCVSQDGRNTYCVQLTLIDCGYLPDTVFRFIDRYETGVYAVRGRDAPPKSSPHKEFWATTNATTGQIVWSASVDMYKDRWSAALKRAWDGQSLQPEGHFNAPLDATDAQLKELTVETRREKIDDVTNRSLGFGWHRPSGADNELWDLLIYNNVALDVIAYDVCIRQRELPQIDWNLFWSSL
jgi:phage terminase large subunit GpA-like protein